MKIVQVSPFYKPHIGGVESHVAVISRELASRGHDVEIITSRYDKSLPKTEEIDGVNITRVKTVFTMFNTPVTPDMKRVVMNTKFDALHAHMPPPLTSFYTARACIEMNRPYVLTYHCDLEIPLFFGAAITSLYRRTLGKFTMSHAKKIVLHTESYAATSRQVWKYDTQIIPSAVDEVRFRPGLDGSDIQKRFGLEGKRVMLYIGRLVYHKGLKHLIDSLAHLPKDVVLLIVGKGPVREKLERYASEAGQKERVIFAGVVSFDELPLFYSACDVFVLPSTSRLEAFGLVSVEAMACQKPVLISNIPGVREVIDDGVEGLLIEPIDPKDIAQKASRILSDDSLAHKMGQNGRNRVEKEYTWTKVASRLEKLYKTL